jgi:Hint-domain
VKSHEVARAVQGAGAADELLVMLGHADAPIEKALNPLVAAEFDRIVARVAAELFGETYALDQQFAEGAMAALDIGWDELTAAEREDILQSVLSALPSPPAYALAVAPIFAKEVEQLVLLSRVRTLTSVKLPKFDLTGDEVVAFLREGHPYFVANHMQARNDAIDQAVRVLIGRAIEEGWRKKDVARALRKVLGPTELHAKSQAYYDVTAGAFVATARSYGQLTALRDAGIEYYRWESVLDEVTCFAAGTRVRLADGRERAIELVRPGDRVLSCRGYPRRVTALRVFSKRAWGTLRLDDGTTLRVTPNHPILTLRGWVRAGQLRLDDEVVRARKLRGLWRETESEGDAENAPVVHEASARCDGAATRVRGVQQAVSTRVEYEARAARVLLGGMQGAEAHLRALSHAVSGALHLRAARSRQVLLDSMPEGVVPEGRDRCGDQSGLREVRGAVLHLTGRSSSREAAPALFECVPDAACYAGVRGVWCAGDAEAIERAAAALLQRGVPYSAPRRDLARSRSAEGAYGGGLPVRAGEEDRPLVSGLFGRGEGRAGGRWRVLAPLAPDAQTRCETRSGARSARVHGGAPCRSRDSEGPALCASSLGEVWPYPVEDLRAAGAQASGIVALDWELIGRAAPAYDLEVEQDAGYLAEDVVVHNSDVCRFMHGTVFLVKAGLQVFERMAGHPDNSKEASPWLRTGKDEEGRTVLYTKAMGHRRNIATVVRSGVGTRDDQGEFETVHSADSLEDLGICLPPAHGNCRSTIVAAEGPGG